ncbi:MAG: hypothetical protein JWR18_2403 [Segetibacter sp.]|nr:hypothetical protein [Segetibacter sp.]
MLLDKQKELIEKKIRQDAGALCEAVSISYVRHIRNKKILPVFKIAIGHMQHI